MKRYGRAAMTAAAALLAVTVTACQTDGATAGTGTDPSASANPPASAPSALPEPSPSSVPDQGDEKQQIQTKLTNFMLLDRETGFAWGETEQALRIYKTEDAGDSWVAVTPEDGTENAGNPSLYFVDDQLVWAAISNGEQPVQVLRTEDGGASWHSTVLDKPGYPVITRFIDENQGWLLTASDAAMGKSEKTLYATTNGGVDWASLAQTPSAGDPEGQSPYTLPLSGHTVGLTFTDEGSGWLSLTSPAEVPQLFRTSDGGKTWDEVAVDVPQQLEGVPLTIADGPEFYSDSNGQEGWFTVRRTEGNTAVLDAYITSDGGESWTYQELGMEEAVRFLDPQRGWGFKNRVLHRTEDGGVTWIPLDKDPVLQDMLSQFQVPVELQFITPEDGWLLLGNGGGDKSRLLKTDDGGESWTGL